MPSPMESLKKNKPILKTSCEASVQITSLIKEKLIITKDGLYFNRFWIDLLVFYIIWMLYVLGHIV